jgi:hypothetical protein
MAIRPSHFTRMRFILSDGFRWQFCIYDSSVKCYYVSAVVGQTPNFKTHEALRNDLRSMFVMLDHWVRALVSASRPLPLTRVL